MLDRADRDRVDETVTLARGSGVMAGMAIALCLGVDPKHVLKVGEAMLGGEPG